ncbi:MAG: tetratricopeptide repeat protein [Usitatibacter sp.]
MNRAVRLVAVAPAVAALAWLAVHSLHAGVAGSRVFDAGVAMRSWDASQSLTGMRESLESAQDEVPRDPALHELLGLVAARSGDRPEFLGDAAVHFVKAIELRPTSPQSWGDLAAVKYRLGETDGVFEAAIVHAGELGGFEPDVQAIVANYGLAVWNEVGPTTRASVEATLAKAMKRNPLEMLQIAERRGRLEVVCRHLAGSTRQADPKWSHLCQSMEATS